MKTILRLCLVNGIFAFVCAFAYGQELNNPNKLAPCPKIDVSATYDVGVGGRTGKWTNCWGRYKVELSATHKGDVLEGEWLNGNQRGQETATFANGDKYVGEWKDDKRPGQGTATFARGNKYVGEFKDGTRQR